MVICCRGTISLREIVLYCWVSMAEWCDVLAGAARLQRDLIDVRAEKQRLADKLEVLEADARQYQEELRLSQVGHAGSAGTSMAP